MNQKSRLELLQEMLEQDPNDDFCRYGVALELKKLGRTDEALDQLDELIRRHPDYVPAFFMSGQFLAEGGRTPEAADRLRQGIQVAQRIDDRHARMEMQEFLDRLLQEESY